MINTGATSINYGNLIILGLVIICGIILSVNDAAQNRADIATEITEITETIPHFSNEPLDDLNAATYNAVTNSLDVTQTIQMVGVIVLICCIAFSMYFMRGMA